MSARKAKSRAGRPPLAADERKAKVLILRLSNDEKRVIEAAAERAGESVSAWARKSLADFAQRTEQAFTKRG